MKSFAIKKSLTLSDEQKEKGKSLLWKKTRGDKNLRIEGAE
jgi:hypothetical protein